MNRTLLLQVAIILISSLAIFQWAANFPFPSPLVKPVLPPTERWPAEQVSAWVHAGNFSSDFLDYFARDPDREVPPGNSIVAPADGFVREMAVLDGKTFLMIQLTVWDVHVVRTPVAGVVKSIHEEGITLFRNDPKDVMFLRGKVAPVQKIVTLETDMGEVAVRLISNYWASRIKIWVAHGQRLEKGERFGRMLAGSTVVAEFPGEIELSVEPMQQVYGGETIVSPGAKTE